MKYYSKDHEWVELDGDLAVIGISEHAAGELGDITYVELPLEDADVIVGDALGVIESVKAASDIYSPVSGTVSVINTLLDEDPSILNSSPECEGWICKIDNFDPHEIEDLMDEEKYAKFLSE